MACLIFMCLFYSTMAKPLIAYYGGKQNMAHKILPLFPPHTVYVEPFCGGAALLFAKPKLASDRYREVLNDKNNLITTLYRVAIEQPEAFEAKLQATLYSRHEYKKAVAICKNPGEYGDLDIAWATYVNCNQSFATQLNNGWGFGVISQNHAKVWQSRLSNLKQTLERLQEVYVESDDAIKVIQRWDSPQTLFYCDPPYINTNQGHYSGYTQDDFVDLVETLDSIQGSFVLSTYENEAIPAYWERFEFKALNSSAKSIGDKSSVGTRENSERTELVFRKISTTNARPDLIKYLKQSKHEQLSLFA